MMIPTVDYMRTYDHTCLYAFRVRATLTFFGALYTFVYSKVHAGAFNCLGFPVGLSMQWGTSSLRCAMPASPCSRGRFIPPVPGP